MQYVSYHSHTNLSINIFTVKTLNKNFTDYDDKDIETLILAKWHLYAHCSPTNRKQDGNVIAPFPKIKGWAFYPDGHLTHPTLLCIYMFLCL